LIGKEPVREPTHFVPPSRAGPGGGLYAGGPRRPGGLLRGNHGRTQSMAVSSSPDLLARSSSGGNPFEGRSSSAGIGHQKSRFGGSVAGMNGASGFEDARRTSGHVRGESNDGFSGSLPSSRSLGN
jgi:hypothetical protein